MTIKDWIETIQALNKIKLNTLVALMALTAKRLYDGAALASITVVSLAKPALLQVLTKDIRMPK